MDEIYSPEEIMILIGDEELIKKYKLLDMYSVTENKNDKWVRKCEDCKLPSTIVEFHYGIRTSRCKACTKIFMKIYNKKNREILRVKQKAYRDRRKIWLNTIVE